ncbi:MAG: PCRF domain-containing protein, partial [Chloroflexi bacterium]|nr:PCRF domain-containing protein [Chloroflexota bacterium]
MKRSTTDKDAKKAFLNALWLFSRDPGNLAYLEAVAKNGGRLRAEDSAKWAAGVFLKALESAPKASIKQYQALGRLTEELGDRAAVRGETTFGVEVYQTGVQAIALWRRKAPKDHLAESALKNLSTKLTILKGRYQDGSSFRESMADAEEQAALGDDIRDELASLEAEYARLELALTLGGEYDSRNAVISLHAGAGGTEAQDWAEMLLRMYLRWGAAHDLETEVLSISNGEEAGSKSVEVRMAG